MADHDERRVHVAAPREGRPAQPPPRRRPRVVEPADDPRNEPPAPAGTAPAPRSVFDDEEPAPAAAGPDVPPGVAVPRGSGPGGRDRVVVPAPGAQEAVPPPDDRRRPRPAASAEENEAQHMTAPAPEGFRRFLPSRRVVLGVAAVFLLLVGGVLFWSYRTFNSIETVDLSAVLSSDNGTNYLIVGSDTREGIDPDDPTAGGFLGEGSAGGPERSDTMMILRIDGRGARTMSIPRDLWVTIAETGSPGKINGAFNGGPGRLIATITDQLGIPIHHYLEIDFVAFGDVVDSVGGVTIDFPYPAYDTSTGFRIDEAGEHTLDGDEALAYVRARKYHQIIDGQDTPDGLGDLDRVVRQQQFLAALGDRVTGTRNPFRLVSVANAVSDGMRVDSDLGYFDALSVLRNLGAVSGEPINLPVSFGTVGAASVVNLVQPDADEVLADFGSPGAAI